MIKKRVAALLTSMGLGLALTAAGGPAAASTDRAHIHNPTSSWAGFTLYNEPCGTSYSNTRLLMPGDSTDNHGWDCVDAPGSEPFYVDVYDGGNGGLIIRRYYSAGTNWKVKLYNANDYVITLV
jgi:hypothetical protein